MRATITLLGLQLKMPRSVHHYIDNDRDSLCGRSGQINNMSMSHSITVFTPAFWILLGFITRLPLLYIGTCIQGGQFHVIMPIAISLSRFYPPGERCPIKDAHNYIIYLLPRLNMSTSPCAQ